METKQHSLSSEQLSDLVRRFIPAYPTVLYHNGESIKDLQSYAFLLRQVTLMAISARVQRNILQNADTAGLPPGAHDALFASKVLPYIGFMHEDMIINDWPFAVDLILNATDYEPYTFRHRPVGDHIIFVNHTTEYEFLDSLVALGEFSWADSIKKTAC